MTSRVSRRKALGLGLSGVAAVVTGCGGRNADGEAPRRGLFSEPDTLEPEGGYARLAVIDTRPLVPQVSAVRVEPTPGGVIVRATGLAPTAGYWDAALVPQPAPEGSREMQLEFRVRPPRTVTGNAPTSAREIQAAHFLTNQDIDGVSRITVIGGVESRSSSR